MEYPSTGGKMKQDMIWQKGDEISIGRENTVVQAS